MRVISQKGFCYQDIPYERSAFYMSTSGTHIYANCNGIVYSLAEYSTADKAEKAMQKLHECHIGIHAVGGLDDTVDCSSLSQIGIYKINENGDYAYKLPAGERIFRFPQDDEL